MQQSYNIKTVANLAEVNILKKILYLGIKPELPELDRKRIYLLNIFYLLSSLTFAASSVQSLLYDDDKDALVMLLLALAFQAGVPFMVRGKSHAAAIYLMIILNLNIFYFNNVQGWDAGVYLFYFPILLADAWLMDFKRPGYNFLLAGITIFFVALGFVLPDPLSGKYPSQEQIDASFVFSVLMSSLLLAANIFVTSWLSYRDHQNLSHQLEEKQKAAEIINQSLREKDILLAEIHHRVKNNLAVIRSLLNLQMNAAKSEEAKSTLRESMHRVSSMALIHQKLYRSHTAETIDLNEYIKELSEDVCSSYYGGKADYPDINITGDPVFLNLNKAIPCGLIINELISNTLKHAFIDSSHPRIEVETKVIGREIEILIRDNGVGLPEDFDPKAYEQSLGMTIIHSLAEQLDGNIEFSSEKHRGTAATLRFRY